MWDSHDIDLDRDPAPVPRMADGRSDRERELGAELVRRREAGERDGDLPRAIAEAEAAREALKGGWRVKVFTQWEVEQAVAHAAAGGQALHLHRVIVDPERAPRCFVREVDAGRDIAHLFDQDEARLIATARGLGVRVVVVERRGQPGQHVDLCGGPLRKAVEQAGQERG